MHCDKFALFFSASLEEPWHEYFIFRDFELVSHRMDGIYAIEKLNTCKFIQSVRGDSLPYRCNVDIFGNEVQLGFGNAMGDNWLEIFYKAQLIPFLSVSTGQ